MSALLAAVQVGATFGTLPLPIHILRQRGRAVETTRRHHVLQKTGQAGTRYIDGRPWTRRFWPLCGPPIPVFPVAVRIHIPALSVFAIVVHALNRFPWELSFTEARLPECGAGASVLSVQGVGSMGSIGG